jgi:hypothetical protein
MGVQAAPAPPGTAAVANESTKDAFAELAMVARTKMPMFFALKNVVIRMNLLSMHRPQPLKQL